MMFQDDPETLEEEFFESMEKRISMSELNHIREECGELQLTCMKNQQEAIVSGRI